MKIPPEEKKQIENEMLYRRINEKVGFDLNALDDMHIAEGNSHLVRDDLIVLHFRCECSDENCKARVAMRLSRYTSLHNDRSCFIIKPNHEVKSIEKVIESEPTYSVVKKNNITPEPREGAEFNKTSIDNS